MIETIKDILKFFFMTIPGWIILGALMLFSWFLTGELNPLYILWFIYKKIFVWK